MTERIVAVIHARGGSKRIPLKNLALLNGKPLLYYPIALAKSSRFINRIILSTDHDGIIEMGLKLGAEVPFRRPSDISEDVPSELVTLHALQFLAESEKYEPSIVVTLTPATPFTEVQDVDMGISMLLEHPDWDSVVTVRKSTEHPEWMMRKDPINETFSTVLGNPLNGKYNVSQNLAPSYYPSGAFFVNRVTSLIINRDLYGTRFGAVELSQEKLDIDTPQDLEVAKRRLTNTPSPL